jgi:hypothetical protein
MIYLDHRFKKEGRNLLPFAQKIKITSFLVVDKLCKANDHASESTLIMRSIL